MEKVGGGRKEVQRAVISERCAGYKTLSFPMYFELSRMIGKRCRFPLRKLLFFFLLSEAYMLLIKISAFYHK